MKTFGMIRDGHFVKVAETSWWDMVRMLFGREIRVDIHPFYEAVIFRAGLPYELFNLSAPAQKIIDGDQDNLRKEN